MDTSKQDHQATDPPSLRQRTPSATSPRTSSETAQVPSATSHSNEKTAVYEHSCELESQSGTQDASTKEETQTSVEEVQDNPEGLSQLISRVRLWTWWFIVALLIAIPLSAFATVFSNVSISGIKVTGFILWLEIIWIAAWFIHLLVWLVSKGWFEICQTGRLGSWDEFLLNTSTSQLLFFLSLVAWGSSWIMCQFSDSSCNMYWLHVLQKVLLATIPATAIFLVKNLLLEVLIKRQTDRMFATRKGIIFRQYNAFDLLQNMIREEPKKSYLDKLRLWLQKTRSLYQLENGFIFLKSRSPAANDYGALLMRYMLGHDRDEDFEVDNKTFVSQMRDEHREMFKSILTGADGNIIEDIDEEFFRKRLELPQIKKMNRSFYMGEEPLTAKEMLKILDKDGNRKIGLEECVEANVEIMMAFRDVCKSAHGVYRVAKSVDVVISCLLLCIVAILYAAFFTKHLSDYLTPIWTTVTGLSFALAGTVTEFISACGFVFSKQPYDIGDRVIIQEKDLIVEEICLLYTVFHRASDGAIEQIAHKVICDSWITNLSRSRGLSVKESVAVPESADTISKPTLDSYQAALENFIKENPVRSRYLNVNDFQISLQAGKDGCRQIVAVIKLRELIVRREGILAGVRNEVRDKLEELIRTPLVAS